MSDNPSKPPVTNIWANGAGPTDITTPTQAFIEAGWLQSTTPPSRQKFNWLINFLFNGVRYFSRAGIPDYDAAETYQASDFVRLPATGALYRSLGTNINSPPNLHPEFWDVPLVSTVNVPLTDNSGRVVNTSWITGKLSSYALQVGTYASMSVGHASSADTATTAATAGSANNVPYTGVTGKPTTVGGFGITDAVTTSNAGYQLIAGGINLTFDLVVGIGRASGQVSTLYFGKTTNTTITGDGVNIQLNAPSGFGYLNGNPLLTFPLGDGRYLQPSTAAATYLTIANAASLYAQLASFSASFTLNGYARFPGGLVHQWGYANGPAGAGGPALVTVSFPIVFPNTCLNAVTSTAARSTPGQLGSGYTYTFSAGAATFLWDAQNSPANTVGGYWQATGY